ncbi:MAG: M17 family peptidase N-terminal domain-containing protein [Pseudomonadota bacterium]
MNANARPSLWTPNLDTLDSLDVDDLVLGVFSDVRPLPGVAGLVDWRMCGTLSRFVREGRLGGAQGERVLIPGAGRVGARRVFLFGLGPREHYARRITELAAEIPQVVRQAGSRRAVLALPGPSRVIGPAMERMVGELGGVLLAIFDHDGKLGDWVEGSQPAGGA